jgi:hypothetical protein
MAISKIEPSSLQYQAGNGPAFSAYASAAGSGVSSYVFTKFLFDAEMWDTNSNFTSSRFTPTVAGYYQINSTIQYGTVFAGFASIWKNGADTKRGTWSTSANLQEVSVSGIVYLNGSTDYVEIYGYQNVAGNIPQYGASVTFFDGALVRAA